MMIGAESKVFYEREIGSAAVGKYPSGLTLCSRDRSESVTGRIKHKRTSFCQDVGTNSEPRRRWYANHQASSRLVHIGLNSRQSGGSKIVLTVSVITIDRFRC